VSLETKAFGWLAAGLIAVSLGLVAVAVVYEQKHPCLRYATHQVFVPELTTYISLDGGIPIGGGMTSKGGMTVPVTTPAHYEEETVCEERR
jgi:hypothetical protein